MYNITLVSTHHSELGKCSSDELVKIIESISPNVIFEEICPALFDRFYKKNDIPIEIEPLEIKAVKKQNNIAYIRTLYSQIPIISI